MGESRYDCDSMQLSGHPRQIARVDLKSSWSTSPGEHRVLLPARDLLVSLTVAVAVWMIMLSNIRRNLFGLKIRNSRELKTLFACEKKVPFRSV